MGLVGISYRSAPMALRERVAFGEEQIPQALTDVGARWREGFVLSTCNRTEFYVVGDHSPPSEGLLAELRGIDRRELAGRCYTLREEEAVRHLFRVASGLDSMVLGETQILGQAREAFETALACGTIGRTLGRVLPLALEVGKRARAETGISRRALSPSSVAVELARRELGDLRPCTALVIGSGDAGRATARSLKGAGVTRLLLVNRTVERALAAAQAIGAEAIPYGAMAHALAQADIVITSTGASDHVVTDSLVREVLPARGGRPLLCIDIAVPRDIDPAVGQLPAVVLYNIDDLEALCEDNRRVRTREIAAVEAIVEEGLADYRSWRAVEPLVPTIGALYQRAEAIRRAEIRRTLPRLGNLSQEDQDLIEVMTASIVRRLLHGPVAALKARGRETPAEELARLAHELFALPPAQEEETPP